MSSHLKRAPDRYDSSVDLPLQIEYEDDRVEFLKRAAQIMVGLCIGVSSSDYVGFCCLPSNHAHLQTEEQCLDNLLLERWTFSLLRSIRAFVFLLVPVPVLSPSS